MKISCPQCRTAYDVQASSLGQDGRSVRCARCQTVWFVEPAAASAPVIPFPVHDARAAPLPGAVRREGALAHRSAARSAPSPAGTLPPGFKIVPAGSNAMALAAGAEPAPADALAFAMPAEVAAPPLAPEAETLADELASPDADAETFAAETPAEAAASDAVEGDPGIPSPDAVIPARDRIADPPLPPPEAAPVQEVATAEAAAKPAAAGPKPQQADVESIAARRLRTTSGKRRLSARRSRPQWRISVLTAAILVLATFDAGLLVWRADVVRVLPQTATLFRALGMPVNLRHLAFTSIRATQEQHDGVTILALGGLIHATGANIVEVPRLRFAIQAANGHEIYAWTVLPTRTRLARGETLPFQTRLASPPEQGQRIQVRFFNRHDVAAGMR